MILNGVMAVYFAKFGSYSGLLLKSGLRYTDIFWNKMWPKESNF